MQKRCHKSGKKKRCDTARTQGEGSGSLSGKSGRLAENGYTCQGFVPAFGPCRVLQRRLLKKKKEVATGDLKFHFELRIKVPPAGIHFFYFFLFFRRKLCLWNPAVQMNGNKKRNGPHSPTSGVKLQTHFARFALKLKTNPQTRLVKFSAAMSQNTSWCASSIHKKQQQTNKIAFHILTGRTLPIVSVFKIRF